MKKFKKLLLWYFMFTKRLFKRYSFLVLLLLIPLIVPASSVLMGQDSGMVTVALYSRNPEDKTAQAIVDTLVSEDSIVRYRVCSSEDEALSAVKSAQADAAWIFTEDLESQLEAYATKKSSRPFIEIYAKEENVPLRLSQEKLYGAVYPHITYNIYKKYVYENYTTPDELPAESLKFVHDSMDEYDNIITVNRLNSDEEVVLSKNFLALPLRGLLAIVVLLCAIAAAMYFLRDSAEGKFDWLSPKKRLAPAFGSCFSASLVSGIIVFVTLLFSEIFTTPLPEIAAMLMYALAVAGFCLVLCIVFRSAGKLGASIPFVVIITLVLCPIFFNLNVLKPLQHMLPTYYYLNSLYDARYMMYMPIYCIGVFAVAFALNFVLNSRERRASH